MSEKLTCPGCDAHTSSVLMAAANGEPCPYCGLSNAAMVEISMVRRSKADDKLKARVEELLKANSRLERENEDLRMFRIEVADAMASLESKEAARR